jgi:2-methylcitrate dehydratase PrpD
VRHLANPAPATVVDAQFSLPHCLALCLLEVPPHRWHAQENLRDPAIQTLAARVSVHSDPEAHREYLARERPDAGAVASVVVRLRTGEQLEASADLPPTARHDPLPADVIIDKFLRNAEPVLGETGAREIVERIQQLDHAQSIRPLMALLRPAGARSAR